MKSKGKLFSILIVIFFLWSCATSMTPSEVNNLLPTLTNTTFYNKPQAIKALKNNKCSVLVKGRSYVAPIGTTVKNDLKNAAYGIDEWVKIDGGNAYSLVNYKWVTVDHNGSTQLHVDFDTMLCK
ncbi:hypothetical protein [Mangrovimonas cancribranchiae]|uniref:Lipoprotein n=1 Tax=Mangrovimonas cancribranchiae TaxID=3080055 RepID=A0AAU6NW63_9FLAO